MSVHVHFDRPAGPLVQNLVQEFCGWIAIPKHAKDQKLEFLIDGAPIAAQRYQRPDAERIWGGSHVEGWTFWLDQTTTFQRARRTLEFSVRVGGHPVYKRHFYKSRSLMPRDRDGALYFMHIPKTAGTALRAYVDFAFKEFASCMVYGQFPGVSVDEVTGTYRSMASSRELFYGHFDFALVQELRDNNPKIVTVFREPDELIQSYLSFHPDPVPVFLDNPLTRHVCGLSYAPPFGLIRAEHLDMALRRIESFHIVQQPCLQQFADELSLTFGLARFILPRVNVGSRTNAPSNLPFDISFDIKLYQACQHRWQPFLSFLDS